jgi:N-methylhydantoinase B
MTHGAQVPNSTGLFGGWPGTTVTQTFLPRDAAADEPPRDLGPKPGTLPIRAGDVFSVVWQGGGGYGDPLLREPADVAADLRAGLLDAATAQSLYGVVVGGLRVDVLATDRRRRELRAARIGVAVDDLVDPVAPGGRPLGPALVVADEDGELTVRSTAGVVLSRGHSRWRRGATASAVDPTEHGITLHVDLAMTAFYCPASGLLLAVDVHRRDDEPLDDLDLTHRSSS